jgi:putative phosphoribosyl transferase
MDIMLVRKLGVPQHEEMAMGAIAMGGVIIRNDELIKALHIPETAIEAIITKETTELLRRDALYRNGRPLPELTDHTVILIDDGIATGATVSAAIAALRRLHPAKIIVAVPVAPASTIEELKKLADDVVVVFTPEYFRSVGLWYDNFAQTTDEEVQAIMEQIHQTVKLPHGGS